jgi:predicted XRE-type DNA-binding protein
VAKKIRTELSSGNVFADIGLTNPEERIAKAALASTIVETLRAKRLTQTRTARLLGIDQPRVSRLLRGQLAEFSTERLLRFVTLLGQVIEIVIKRLVRSRAGRLRVVAA